MAIPFIPTAGAVRTDIGFYVGDQQAHNVIWCTREAPWTQSQREDLNDAIETWWTTIAKPNFAPNVSLYQVMTVNQDTQSAPSSILAVSPAVPGTGTTNGIASGTAECATLRTDLRGRNYRGRIYLPPCTGTFYTNAQTFSAGGVAAIISVLADLKTAIEALGAIWVVVSKYLNKMARAQGLKTPITAITVDNYWDSLRRRLGGRGV